MKRLPKSCFILVCAILLCSVSSALGADKSVLASDVWQFLNEVPQERAAGRPWVRPERFQPVMLNLDVMKSSLRDAPLEIVGLGVRGAGFIVELPMPDGSVAAFEVVESPIMEPGLAAQFPEIKTYLGQGLDDPSATVRFDVTPAGFHSQVIGAKGVAAIDPYTFGDTAMYACYWKQDLGRGDGFDCQIPEHELNEAVRAFSSLPDSAIPRTSGTNLRTFRLACAATGEYTAFHGGTVALGQAAIVTAINRVTQVYELEVAVRLTLIANNNLIVYTNGATDPYTNTNGSAMLTENQNNLTAVIGSANYDIGHVFSTGGGGVASLGVVCSAGSKARGVTGLPSPTGDTFYIDFVAHEMGHQFAGAHTFNGTGGNCSGQRTASAAFEPGSGSTIMAYAGICGSIDNLQSFSDAYFLSYSHEQIMNFITNSIPACGTNTATGNTVPTVDAGPVSYNIPSGTPFILTATGNDGNGDPLTFCWEERDLGPAQQANQPDNGSSPLFRSRTGTSVASRTCPSLNLLLASNFTLKGERIPITNRTMNWRVTARDNRAGGGGVISDSINVIVTTAGGAFGVTAPNTAVSWSGVQTVTWSVAGTNGPPVNCANVNILLSTDQGQTFPTMLLANTPNDGSEAVTLPNINTTNARIKVESVGNIFLDISTTNFTITPAAPAAPTGVVATPPVVCSGGASSLTANVGPGEAVDWFTAGCGTTPAGTGSPLGVNPVVTTTYFAQGRNIGSGLVGPCTSVTVIVAPLGDANGSGVVNDADVGPFVDGVVNGSGAVLCALDMNGDTLLDGVDIVLFTDAVAP
jgi:hypothetical protein